MHVAFRRGNEHDSEVCISGPSVLSFSSSRCVSIVCISVYEILNHISLKGSHFTYLQNYNAKASGFRGDVPPPINTYSNFNQTNDILHSFDDGTHLNKPTVNTAQGRYFTGNTADYSSCSHRSRIVTSASQTSKVHQPSLKCADFKGGINEPDKKPLDNHKKKDMPLKSNIDLNVNVEHLAPDQCKSHGIKELASIKNRDGDSRIPEKVQPTSYNKSVYPVLVGDSVKVCNTKLYASLPQNDKYMVKEAVPDSTRFKLVLKSSCVKNNQ